jgi:hypothetical protein
MTATVKKHAATTKSSRLDRLETSKYSSWSLLNFLWGMDPIAAKSRSIENSGILLSRFLRLEDSMISLKPESPEELRKRLREMSNLELRRFGERARKLSDPKMNFGAREPHVLELEEARAEWRRRHPK